MAFREHALLPTRHCFRIWTITRPRKPCTWKPPQAPTAVVFVPFELTTAPVVPKSVLVDPTLNARRALIFERVRARRDRDDLGSGPVPVARSAVVIDPVIVTVPEAEHWTPSTNIANSAADASPHVELLTYIPLP